MLTIITYPETDKVRQITSDNGSAARKRQNHQRRQENMARLVSASREIDSELSITKWHLRAVSHSHSTNCLHRWGEQQTLWCSQTSHDSKLLHKMDVAIPPTRRPANSTAKLLKCCIQTTKQSISHNVMCQAIQHLTGVGQNTDNCK